MDLSPELKLLIEDWDFEYKHFKRIEKRFFQSISTITELNKEIYTQCLKEGIEMSSLNLVPKEEVKP